MSIKCASSADDDQGISPSSSSMNSDAASLLGWLFVRHGERMPDTPQFDETASYEAFYNNLIRLSDKRIGSAVGQQKVEMDCCVGEDELPKVSQRITAYSLLLFLLLLLPPLCYITPPNLLFPLQKNRCPYVIFALHVLAKTSTSITSSLFKFNLSTSKHHHHLARALLQHCSHGDRDATHRRYGPRRSSTRVR